MKRVVRAIDSISEYSGKAACWFCVALFVVLCYEVTARYVFNAPALWNYETVCMMGITIASLGWAYTHRVHGHIRVGVFYAPLSPRKKAMVDVVVGLTFFPAFIILAYFASRHMLMAWSVGEVLAETIWYPPAGPIRTVLFLGISLFILQGLAQLTRDFYFLIRNRPL